MATTSTGSFNPDNTTTNFYLWANFISAAFSSFGWFRATDTGQIVLTATVLTCTSVSVTTTTATYNFSSFTGPTPRIGMSFTFSVFGIAGNNVTATITATNGSSFVTVVLSTQATDTTGSGTTTQTAQTVSVNTATGYEIWETNDAVAFNFFVKVEYGNGSTATFPAIWMTGGSTTDGKGNVGGGGTRTSVQCGANDTVNATLCHASGNAGNFRLMMWHGVNSNANRHFAINLERSHSSTGADTSQYYTAYITGGSNGGNTGWCYLLNASVLSGGTQQTFFNILGGGCAGIQEVHWIAVIPLTVGTMRVNGTLGVSPLYPTIGGIGNPQFGYLLGDRTDWSDGTQVVVNIYGTNHNYIVQTIVTGTNTLPVVNQSVATFMRYE